MRWRTIIVGGLVGLLVLMPLGCIGLSAVASARHPSTPLDAGREWFVPKDGTSKPDHSAADFARVLAQQEVAPGKQLILYAWRSTDTTPPTSLSVVLLGISETHSRLLPWWPRVGWH